MAAFGEISEMDSEELDYDLPHYYANSFMLGLSNADFNMTLVRNGRPQAIVNMSYTTLKTLAVTLNQAIAQLEEATGREIMTVDVVGQSLQRAAAEGEK